MSIGLKRGTVKIEPHSVEWEISAEKLIQKLSGILKNDIVAVQHIGSTAIKNICAKPIVDIVVGVSNFEKMLNHNDELRDMGIVYRGEYHSGQLLYVCGDFENCIQTHFIHVVIWGHDAWNNYINMRDYLNSHSDAAKKYDELKRTLAEKYPDDRNAYTNAKSELINDILNRAKQWRELSDKVYYHVVTERPMRVGQHIIFDDRHHSGVYSRVMGKCGIANEIYTNPENYNDDELEHHTRVALRELAMEEIRREKYSDFPSRMSSLYVSRTLEEANKWFDFFTEIGRPTFQIVKVRVNGRVFEGNANRCYDGSKNKNYNLKMAEEYWANDANVDKNNNPVVEVLVDGDIEVVEILRVSDEMLF